MKMVTMYDSVDVTQIPRDAKAVAGYVGGRWPTYPTLHGLFPRAYRLSIAISAKEDADGLDIETGDARAAEAPTWVVKQHHRGVLRPVIYVELSEANKVVKTLTLAGIKRHEYRLWVAHYTGVPHLCGPDEGLNTYADATQWECHALGCDLDISLCSNSFFGAAPLPVSTWRPSDELRWETEFDDLKQKHGLWPAMRCRVLVRVMTHRRQEIWKLAQRSGWDIKNRDFRYRELWARTG